MMNLHSIFFVVGCKLLMFVGGCNCKSKLVSFLSYLPRSVYKRAEVVCGGVLRIDRV